MAFIDGHRERWSVAAMCRVLEFSQRTYYAARARPASSRSLADEEHKSQIRRVWENNYRVYGPRRVWRQLHREGHPIARCRVAASADPHFTAPRRDNRGNGPSRTWGSVSLLGAAVDLGQFGAAQPAARC